MIRKEQRRVESMKKALIALTVVGLLLAAFAIPVLARAGEISGPGSPDGRYGTYFWYRDNKWTSKDRFWANRGHLKLSDGRTHTFTWTYIDDSEITGDKQAWQVFVMDAGEGSHGWEQIAMQVRKDESWYQPDRVIRLFANWGGLGQVVVPQGPLDLRLVLRQNTEDDKWHIEAWYNTGGDWTQFYTGDDINIATSWSGLPGDLTQACAGIQIDKESDGTLYFHPAAPMRR
jgi:hypothetical protein